LTQAGGFALAAVEWGIPLREAALGYAWCWLENQVTTAVKIVPLGQTDGQRVLFQLS
jgi:urease accessory protein